MTDAYLRSLGFAPAPHSLLGARANRPTFEQAWCYRFEYIARDGAVLYLEHPLGVAQCRLSTLPAPLDPRDVFAAVGLHDRAGLAVAMRDFYLAHGGMSELPPPAATSGAARPYRRQP